MGQQKGCKKTGGRKKGTPNKHTTVIKDMIIQALSNSGGVKYLERQAKENPGPFLTLVGKVLPMQITGEDGDSVSIVVNLVNKASDD